MTTTTATKTKKSPAAATKTLTIAALKRWAPKLRPLVVEMLAKRAFAEVERKRVDTYIAPVFARFSFVDDKGAAIVNQKRLYRCEDKTLCAAYYTACDTAHREHGFKGEDGECPALVAEYDQLTAEWAVLESMEKFVGLDDGALSRTMEIRAEALKLAAGVALTGR